MTQSLLKAGANWVDGERFFNREFEIATLRERVRHRIHTLITAQRRVGKDPVSCASFFGNSIEEGEYATVFVDLESANDPADAIAEIAIQSRPLENAWKRTLSFFANRLAGAADRIEEVGLSRVESEIASRYRRRELATQRRSDLRSVVVRRQTSSARHRRVAHTCKQAFEGQRFPGDAKS